MRLLRKWFDLWRPKTQGELALHEVMQSSPGTTEAIHLEEVGLPNGVVTTIQWLHSNGAVVARTCRRNKRTEPYEWNEIDRDEGNYKSLIASIRELDSTKIESVASPIRDGVVYFIAWGDSLNIRSVTFRNPVIGSDQHRLVTLIRSSVGQQRIETAGQ